MQVNDIIDKEKNMEILIERLIIMVGKSNERVEKLHKRIQELEYSLLKLQKESAAKKSLIS